MQRAFLQLVCLVGLFLLAVAVFFVNSTEFDFQFRSQTHLVSTRAKDAKETQTLYEAGPDLHRQCSRGIPSGWKNRPMLLFKMDRSGSTWFAWSADKLKLESGQSITFSQEMQACASPNDTRKPQSEDDMTTMLIEYFSRKDVNGTKRLSMNNIRKKCSFPRASDALIASTDLSGVSIISSEGWKRIFRAIPDLAIGVQVRSNTLKHALSGYSVSVKNDDPCRNKYKLRPDEPCTRDLPGRQITVKPSLLWTKIFLREKDRIEIVDAAARVSQTFGDGRLFCLSYESIQHDLAGELTALAEFIGVTIDSKSLEQRGQSELSYKRVSDDLSKFLVNYEEIRDFLSNRNACLLNQLESRNPDDFPLCGIANKTLP